MTNDAHHISKQPLRFTASLRRINIAVTKVMWICVFLTCSREAASQVLSLPVQLSQLAIGDARVNWNGLEFSNFTVNGQASSVTVTGSSHGALSGLSFIADTSVFTASGVNAAKELRITYTVRNTATADMIGGVETMIDGSSTGFGSTREGLSLSDGTLTISTSLGSALVEISSYSAATDHRDVELLRMRTPVLEVSARIYVESFFASDNAILKSFTQRFALNEAMSAGDYSLDGSIDEIDHNVWRKQFGNSLANEVIGFKSDVDADGNSNGIVDAADYVVWRNNFGFGTNKPGDLDGDGDVDGSDYQAWRQAFGSSNSLPDGNKNGTVDASDYVIWRKALNRPGDYDKDGVVDTVDYTIWRLAMGSNNAAADGNGNGIVDAADYVIWRDNFGAGSSPGQPMGTAVPEPSSVWFIFLGLGLVMVWGARAWRFRGCASDISPGRIR